MQDCFFFKKGKKVQKQIAYLVYYFVSKLRTYMRDSQTNSHLQIFYLM